MGKFDERSEEAVFLGYATNSKAYRVYNKNSMCVEESIHIIFDEANTHMNVQELDDIDFDIGLIRKNDPDEDFQKHSKEVTHVQMEEQAEQDQVPQEIQEQVTEELEDATEETGGTQAETSQGGVPVRDFHPRNSRYEKSHPTNLIISDISKGTQTRSQLRNFSAFQAFLSTLEPKNHEEAL